MGLDFGARKKMMVIVTGSFSGDRILDKFTAMKWVCFTNLSGLWGLKIMDFKSSVRDTLTNAISLSLCFKISGPLSLEMILAHFSMIL